MGAGRKASAWVDMGMSGPVLSSALYRELGIGQGRPLRFAIGAVPVEVAGSTVTDGPGKLGDDDALDRLFAPRKVKAILPAGVLQQFQVTLDYAAKQIAVARPGVPNPAGIAVPFRVKEGTGFITVDAAIGGRTYSVVLDAGGGYTWCRRKAAAAWLRGHPDWYRAAGAVGQSNIGMTDYGLEKQGTVFGSRRWRLAACACMTSASSARSRGGGESSLRRSDRTARVAAGSRPTFPLTSSRPPREAGLRAESLTPA